MTISLANGRPEEWIRRRPGHTSSGLERYRPIAATLRELTLGDWTPRSTSPSPSLPPCAPRTLPHLPTIRPAEPRVLQRFRRVGATGFETDATSASDGAGRRENDADRTTQGDAKRREVSAFGGRGGAGASEGPRGRNGRGPVGRCRAAGEGA